MRIEYNESHVRLSNALCDQVTKCPTLLMNIKKYITYGYRKVIGVIKDHIIINIKNIKHQWNVLPFGLFFLTQNNVLQWIHWIWRSEYGVTMHSVRKSLLWTKTFFNYFNCNKLILTKLSASNVKICFGFTKTGFFVW